MNIVAIFAVSFLIGFFATLVVIWLIRGVLKEDKRHVDR
jgi:hypothetical protein